MFLIPSGYNSLAHFIATREPLYRQNVFQFFSHLNRQYNMFVGPTGLVKKIELMQNEELNGLTVDKYKQLYERMV